MELVTASRRKRHMANRIMQIWYEQLYKPYVGICGGKSGLLLDGFVSTIHKD